MLLEVNCGDSQPGGEVILLGTTSPSREFRLNADLTVSPMSNPSVVLGWSTLTVNSCNGYALGRQILVLVPAQSDEIKFTLQSLSPPPPPRIR